MQVLGAGICGTDLHIANDEYPTLPPVTLGHEVCGRVVQLGQGVAEEWIGARVVCETFYSTCQSCQSCLTGRPNLCPERKSIGSGVDGGFAEWLVLPVRNLHHVPEWLGDHAAALAEPLACVANSLCDPSVLSPGDTVIVVGPGPVGLLAAQIARAAGGNVLVVGTERDNVRLGVARELGLQVVLASGVEATYRADVSIECSGTDKGVATALQHVRPGGRHVQIGLMGGPATIPLDEICYREIVVTSGFASTPKSWRRALTLLETKAVQLEPLVSTVVPLAQWEQAFSATAWRQP